MIVCAGGFIAPIAHTMLIFYSSCHRASVSYLSMKTEIESVTELSHGLNELLTYLI